ncbi:cytochrome c oxidase subunit II [Polymorphobacter fuscus]|uniref:Cytochrome c oxidase subunit 2 n=1 Tax=Sandarakinorhabdus fusca TaxID=1439888 RepID=A0A7C9KM65_9SPHN|nr:cytochrome c oxidase subunit II [Polymorphobacter fuscus]KAB7647504.1 cytochrome c oxidase subunit II [Polymorphobacter fuscus]MQT16764.1 cytochrome c oxidase subunit II [Polymorphobacter fuscus]NJC09248.1 cytochrome c oxidase subunit 2 [Polymorphobacter fuscus]
MMRNLSRLFLPLLIALAPLPAFAQTDAPIAAPVETVTTAPVPTATPQFTAPTAGIGQPGGGIQLQTPVTPIGVEAQYLANGVLNPLMAATSVFVLILLAWTVFRYRAAANPVASKTSHNTVVEVVWTLVPVLILVWIAVPSFRLLANQYSPPKADITIKAIGHQWYWEYEYPDQGGFSFDSVMLTDAESAKRGSPKLLDTDNRIVVPAGATVKVLTTAADVIHSFAVPSFWVKMDAVPGRINETWFKVDRPGVYFGQCSELCGTKHAFMPIAVEVVTPARFAEWVAAKQAENGITPEAAVPAAAGQAPPVTGAAPLPAAPGVTAPAGNVTTPVAAAAAPTPAA